MLAKHCLEEFKLDCQLRRLTERTIKGYYNNTLNFLIYAEKHHSITEVEEIYTLHIKHSVQYLLSKKLTAAYTNNILKCLRAYFRFAIQEEYIYSNVPRSPYLRKVMLKFERIAHWETERTKIFCPPRISVIYCLQISVQRSLS